MLSHQMNSIKPINTSALRKLMLLAVSGAVTLCCLPSSTAQAQTLFERRSPKQIDQYRNYAARRRGDLLSVIISESTDVENRDERSLDKTANANVAAGFGYGLGGGLGGATGNATMDQSSSSNRGFTGDSEFRSERQFLDRFTVTVVDVQPNGNLLISGERNISVQGDARTLRLSGIVRQVDLLPNNSISSRLVANLDIRLIGKGPEQKFNKQGPLGRKLNRYWPF
jgi:flagellar L-ring protein precursor FlgH